MFLAGSEQDRCSWGIEYLHEPLEVSSVASSVHLIEISKSLVRNEVCRFLRDPEDGYPNLEWSLNVEVLEDVFLGEVTCLCQVRWLLSEVPKKSGCRVTHIQVVVGQQSRARKQDCTIQDFLVNLFEDPSRGGQGR